MSKRYKYKHNKYEIFGPFPVPLKEKKRISDDKKALKNFWENDVDKEHGKLSEATGCYIFSIKAGRGAKPLYVGQTKKNNFKGRCFQFDKRLSKLSNLSVDRKGTLNIHLVANMTNGGKFKKGEGDHDKLERLLIQFASAANYDLLNIQHAKFLKDLEVPGIINSGKGKLSKPTTTLRKVLNMKNALSVK